MSFAALKQQATEGDVRSMNRVAMCLIQGPDGVEKDFKSALKWLERAAALQSATALYNWNWIYRLGLLGCKKDESKADLCLAQALSAKENAAKVWANFDREARDLLTNHGGLLYRKGCPIPMDIDTALQVAELEEKMGSLAFIIAQMLANRVWKKI